MGAGDIAYWSDVSLVLYPPVGRLVANSSQSLTDNAQVAIQYAAEDWDSHDFHSTSVNNTRVTPTVAGIYVVDATFFVSTLVNGVTIDTNLRTNGSTNLAPGPRLGGAAGHGVAASAFSTANAFSQSVHAQIACDGVSDYWEHMGRQNSGGDDDTNQSSQFSCVMEWYYLRPLVV